MTDLPIVHDIQFKFSEYMKNIKKQRLKHKLKRRNIDGKLQKRES